MDEYIHQALSDVVKGLSADETALFKTQFGAIQKDEFTGGLLAFLLGGLGAHRFYMGQAGWGIFYLLFSWTFIPAIVSFVECFLMSSRVLEWNRAQAVDIVLKLKGARGHSRNSDRDSDAEAA